MLVKVENKNRHKAANKYYFYLRDDNKDYLFSGSQLQSALDRAKSNPEDIPEHTPHEPKVMVDEVDFVAQEQECKSHYGIGVLTGLIGGVGSCIVGYMIADIFKWI